MRAEKDSAGKNILVPESERDELFCQFLERNGGDLQSAMRQMHLERRFGFFVTVTRAGGFADLVNVVIGSMAAAELIGLLGVISQTLKDRTEFFEAFKDCQRIGVEFIGERGELVRRMHRAIMEIGDVADQLGEFDDAAKRAHGGQPSAQGEASGQAGSHGGNTDGNSDKHVS